MAFHKVTPALMIGSLLLGVLLAVAHHLYYRFLDGQIVETQTQQEWYFRIGTGLAFLARAMLSAAVGFAYTQLLWYTLSSKSITIQGVNSFFGILGNAWDFTSWELWTVAPTLLVVAVISWILPLVAVVTPATLTVQVSSQPNVTTIHVPIAIPSYENQNIYSQYANSGGQGYSAPSTYISRLFSSVASTGSISNIPAPYSNSSYSVKFHGPEISCARPDNASFIKAVSEMITNNTSGANSYGFVAFAPNDQAGSDYISSDDPTDEDYALMGLKGVLNSSLVASMPSYDSTVNSTQAAKFYVVVPTSSSSSTSFYPSANNTIECQLYNSSYSANFTFRNGEQDINFKSQRLNKVSSVKANEFCVGGAGGCKPVVAYISLFDALGKLLLGTLYISHYGAMSPTQTQVLSTVLMDSKQMQVLQAISTSSVVSSSINNISMADALEKLFANATISLFSNSNFLQNDTTASDGPITYHTAQNAYSYSPRNLYIAYGLGILVTVILVIIGLICIRSASASYGSSFSTILRTTRNPDLDAVIPPCETSGAEPLSKKIAKTRLILRRQTRKLNGIDEQPIVFFAVDSAASDREMGPRDDSSAYSLLPQHRGVQPSRVEAESSSINTRSGIEASKHGPVASINGSQE